MLKKRGFLMTSSFRSYSFVFLVTIACRTSISTLSHGVFFDLRGGSYQHNNGSVYVNSRRSIQVLTDVKRQASPDIALAIKQCESAILNPKNDKMLKGPSFCLGLLKQSLNDLEGALKDYERAVEHFPKNGAALYNMGGILENLGRDNEAEISFKKAMLIYETSETAFSRLIPLLLRNDREKEAELICNEISQSAPHIRKYVVFEKLGESLYKMGQLEKALTAYESVVKIYDDLLLTDSEQDKLVAALNKAAQVCAEITYRRNVMADEYARSAERYFLRSLEIAPENADTRTYYGVFLKQEKRISEAEKEFRVAIEVDPKKNFKETGYAMVQLASIIGGLSLLEMDQKYVSTLFDGYADRFDKELCGKLEYKGHEQVINALMRVLNDVADRDKVTIPIETPLQSLSLNSRKEYSVLDIGCGTGLCGFLLRKLMPYANISGVDLSQRILEKSVQRECYNNLVLGDALQYLNTCNSLSMDSIIAADVFIYIGGLNKIFEAIYKVLRLKDSYLIFTVEELDQPLASVLNNLNFAFNGSSDSDLAEGGVMLLSSGRFGHSEKYILKLADQTGFIVLSARKEVIRMQSNIPVRSITFVLTKKTLQS
jgi:predicted TPR repeat methyltransferase